MNPQEYETVVSLDEVLITDQLNRRPRRSPDFQAQNAAMVELGNELAVNPAGILLKVSNLAMQLCRAGSAGISILEDDSELHQFRWYAIGGRFAPNLFGTIPQNTSPCGVVIARNEVLLFDRPDRYFAELRGATPRVYEALLAPWYFRGTPKGTLWVLGHSPDVRFDGEDARIVQVLSRFAASAHQMFVDLELARASEAEMACRVQEEAELLSGAFHNLKKEMEFRQSAQDARELTGEALRKNEKGSQDSEFQAAIAERISNSLESISWMLHDAKHAKSRTDSTRLVEQAQRELSRALELNESKRP